MRRFVTPEWTRSISPLARWFLCVSLAGCGAPSNEETGDTEETAETAETEETEETADTQDTGDTEETNETADTDTDVEVMQFTVGGSLSGLTSGSVVLQNNGGDDLTLSEDTWFNFETPIDDGASYEVTVSYAPPGQACDVANATGTIDSANVDSVTVTCTATKLIYTTTGYSGALGGIVGADTKCNNDANKPNGSTYKALISQAGARVACDNANCATGTTGRMDWVLAADTQYYRADLVTRIGTTNANAVFEFPLDHSFLLDSPNEAVRYWSGLDADWTPADYNCSGWSDGTLNGIGQHARLDANDTQAIAYSWQGCSEGTALLCVEQ